MLSLLITWGLITEAGLRYDGVGTQIQSAEGGLKHTGDPMLGNEMLAPSTSFHIVFFATIETIYWITACRKLGIILHMLTKL